MPSLPPDFMARMRAADPSLWGQPNDEEIANRLGWLELPRSSRPHITSWRRLAAGIASEFEQLVLLGMGGSSLAPETFARVYGPAKGFPALQVMDSTHPDAVAAASMRVDPAATLFIVSSKSGTTLETISLFHYFWSRVAATRPDPGAAFIAISDPQTPLAVLGAERGFRSIVAADPNVGGRFSALTAFGLLPAALIGVDIEALLDSAADGLEPPHVEAALHLGTVLAEGAAATADKATIALPTRLEPLGAWLEQLIAESTGKGGTGIIPVVDEPASSPLDLGPGRTRVSYSDDAAAVTIEATPDDLGREMMRWELATAAAGAVLGIHPFNQPDVEIAKQLARRAMSGEPVGSAKAEVPADDGGLGDAVAAWLSTLTAADYVGIQAFLAPDPTVARQVDRIRKAILGAGGNATTFGYGPRFLHSTGQLHKGGTNNGLFLQLIDHGRSDIPIPESDQTFLRLINAQAAGDHAALLDRGRRVLQVCLGDDVPGGIDTVAGAVEAALA